MIATPTILLPADLDAQTADERRQGDPAEVVEHHLDGAELLDRQRGRVPHERPQDLVVSREVLQLLDQLVLAERLTESERLFQPDRGRDRGARELLEARVTESSEHLGDLGFAGRDVTTRKRIGRSQDVRLHGRTLPRPHARNNDR